MNQQQNEIWIAFKETILWVLTCVLTFVKYIENAQYMLDAYLYSSVL